MQICSWIETGQAVPSVITSKIFAIIILGVWGAALAGAGEQPGFLYRQPVGYRKWTAWGWAFGKYGLGQAVPDCLGWPKRQGDRREAKFEHNVPGFVYCWEAFHKHTILAGMTAQGWFADLKYLCSS